MSSAMHFSAGPAAAAIVFEEEREVSNISGLAEEYLGMLTSPSITPRI
jgi:hypothetical protein